MDHYTIVALYGLDAQCKMRLPLLTEKMEKKYGGMDLFHGHPALIVSLRLQHIFAKFDDRPLFWKLISDHTLLKDLKYL